MSRSQPSGHRRRPQALRRHRAAALIALGVALAATPAAAKPKPPKPEITLLTGTERGVLRRDRIKIGIEAKRAKKVSGSAHFVVDGYPEDFPFHLGPQRKGIGDGDATIIFKLSPRQHEVLDFAAQTCRGASLAITARTEERTAALQAGLKLPGEC
ncbi:MAG TPA: hypothetical protein VID76_11090 [Solirubrobacterales bacterium]